MVETWGDLREFVREYGLDQDEYFSFFDLDLEAPLYDEETSAMAVFWVVGGSEGYYAHVQPVYPEGNLRHGRLGQGALGKFWRRERAEEAVRLIQAAVNTW